MELCLHPSKPEAITKMRGTLTRWSLVPTPTVVTTLNDGYDEVWKPVYIAERLAVAPEGELFASATPFPWQEQRAGHNLACVVELRRWQDLEIANRIVVPGSDASLSTLNFSPDGQWLVAANYRLFLIDRLTKHIVAVRQDTAEQPIVATGTDVATMVVNDALWVSAAVFDPTSTYLAVAYGGQGGGYLRLYRIEQGQIHILHQLDRSGIEWSYPPEMDLADMVARMAFSSDGRLLAVYAASQWGMETAAPRAGKKRYDRQIHRWLWYDEVTSAWRVQSGIGRHGEVMLYETKTGRRLWHVPIDATVLVPPVNEQSDTRIYSTPSDIFFTPDSRTVVCGSAIGHLFFFDVATGQVTRHRVADSSDWIFSLALDSSGTTIWAVIRDQLVALPLPQ